MKVFNEEQRIKKWIFIPLLLPLFIVTLVTYKKEETLSLDSDAFWGLLVTGLIVLTVLVFIVSMKLTTKIDEGGIYYQFFPIHFSRKFISWHDIKEVEVISYDSITQFGGYGYRVQFFGKNKGIVMNLSGNDGLKIIPKNGKKLILGTLKVEELKKIIMLYQEKIKNEK